MLRHAPARIFLLGLGALIVAGCEADEPRNSTEYVAKTEGTPDELWEHLYQLNVQHKANKTDDPLLATMDRSSYERAVSKTCNAIVANTSAPGEMRQKAGEFRLEVLQKQLEDEPTEENLKRTLDGMDELEKLGQGTNLVPFAAYKRVIYLSEAPDVLFKSVPERMALIADAAEHLAKVKPVHPQTAELLGKSARASEEAGDMERAKKLLTILSKDFVESAEGHVAAGKLNRLEQHNKVLENFSGPSLTGETVDLKQFRGKVVLIDFWASWCKPCAEEMPMLKRLRDHYQAKGFEILGVDLDDTPETASEFLSNRELAWPQIFDGQGREKPSRKSLAESFGISEIPYKLLIDREGRLVASAHSLAELQKPVMAIFGEPVSGVAPGAKRPDAKSGGAAAKADAPRPTTVPVSGEPKEAEAKASQEDKAKP